MTPSPDRSAAGLALTWEPAPRGAGRGPVQRASRAVGGRVVRCGPLTVAQSGDRVLRRGQLLCALEGRLTNRRWLAERFGRPGDQGDAAVAAAVYEARGEGAVELLRGAFVLVVWDEDRGQGLVARDHLGERSLYLQASPGGLVAATELPALLDALQRRPDSDDAGVLSWLIRGAPPAGRTLYAGVRRLMPGTLLRLRRDGWEHHTYWRLRPARVSPTSDAAARAQLERALHDSVATDLDGVDRAGVLLSGGLDSSLVAAVARAERPELDVVGYSMTFPDLPAVDESSLIRDVAARLGIDSVRMEVRGGSMLGGGLDFLARWGVPCPAPNTAFLAALQDRAATDGITVMLDGEGGDELFATAVQLPADQLRHGRVVQAWRTCRAIPGIGDAPGHRTLLRAFGELAVQGALPPGLQRLRRSLRRPVDMFPPWLDPAAARALAATEDPWAWKRLGGPRWWAHRAHLVSTAREELEVFEILRMLGTGSGLIRRHPLLHRELVETALALAPATGLDPVLDRRLARQIAGPLLPASVAARRSKVFFTPLLHRTLFGADLPALRRLVDPQRAHIRRYIRPGALSAALDAAASARAGFALFAWRLAMIEGWLRTLAGEPPARGEAPLTPPLVTFVQAPAPARRAAA